MKRDCPKLKKQADEKCDDSSKSANVVQKDDSDCSDGDMLSISTNQYVDAWILDFGCSYHITPNREWFSSHTSGNFGSVYLGDDRYCNIIGVGDVRIKVYDVTVRTLSDVRKMSMSLTKRARCSRLNPGLPKSFWEEAVSMACYLINRSPWASLGGKVAEEMEARPEVEQCIFLGYKKGVKGYKFWDPAARKIVISRDAVFDEQSMLQQHQNEMPNWF
ncbi:UNVERIFIED_CONTAM: hypothetical protein Sradi_5429100 [Sesamum radiatum]|uniref:Retrovirus-related Pol polyprotein from transposon TNT 1-94 n=1 Tax=Sesamum radiatum TaxID=300843 RepID=A0AAW2L8Q8_SESRA